MESLVVVQLQTGFVGVVYGFADVVEVVEGFEKGVERGEVIYEGLTKDWAQRGF